MKSPEATAPKIKLGRLMRSSIKEDSFIWSSLLSEVVKFVGCVVIGDGDRLDAGDWLDDEDWLDAGDWLDDEDWLDDVIVEGLAVEDVVAVFVVVGINFSKHSSRES